MSETVNRRELKDILERQFGKRCRAIHLKPNKVEKIKGTIEFEDGTTAKFSVCGKSSGMGEDDLKGVPIPKAEGKGKDSGVSVAGGWYLFILVLALIFVMALVLHSVVNHTNVKEVSQSVRELIHSDMPALAADANGIQASLKNDFTSEKTKIVKKDLGEGRGIVSIYTNNENLCVRFIEMKHIWSTFEHRVIVDRVGIGATDYQWGFGRRSFIEPDAKCENAVSRGLPIYVEYTREQESRF